MRHLSADIDRTGLAFQRIQELWKAFPVPFQAFRQHDAWDILNAFHQVDQRVVVLGLTRGEADAAIAEKHGCHAMPGGRRQHRVPGGLTVIMGVNINPTWRYKQTFRINFALAGANFTTNLNELVAVNGNVAKEALCARSINDRATANDDIMHALASSLVVQADRLGLKRLVLQAQNRRNLPIDRQRKLRDVGDQSCN